MSCVAKSHSTHKSVVVVTRDKEETWVAGLNPVMNCAFYSSFDGKAVARMSKQKSSSSKRRGKKVDKQLMFLTENKSLRRTDPFVKKLWDAFSERGWKIVDCQFPVGCASIGVGTRIDMLLEDKNGDIVIVELKCGFEGYHTLYETQLDGPLEGLSACCYNIHMATLVMSSWMFFHCDHKYSKRRVSDSVLVIVNNSPVKIISIPKPFLHNTFVKRLIRSVARAKKKYRTKKKRKNRIYYSKRKYKKSKTHDLIL